MAKEIKAQIEHTLDAARQSDGLSSDTAYQIWKRVAEMYRLRFQEGYLVRIIPVLLTIGGIVADRYPLFGEQLQDTLKMVFNDERHEKDLLGDLYPSMGIDFTKPSTDEEKNLIHDLSSYNSIRDIPENTKQEVLDFLEEKEVD